jgi:hypothetical protein
MGFWKRVDPNGTWQLHAVSHQADDQVCNKDAHDHYAMGRDVKQWNSSSETDSQEVSAVNIGYFAGPAIRYDPDTFACYASKTTHAVDESYLIHHVQPSLDP